jgi:UDP-N-acetyl-D-galactosamine dehydrogenase
MKEQQSQTQRTDAPRVGVVGAGYVGATLSAAFDRRGAEVTTFDTDEQKIADYSEGNDPVGVIGDSQLAELDVEFSTDHRDLTKAEFILITVPTPTGQYGMPDMSYVEAAGEMVAEVLGPDTVVVLESTVAPGTTRELLVPVLEQGSGLTAGDEFSVGYSPERLSPGDGTEGDIHGIAKLVSGFEDAGTARIAQFYQLVVDAPVHRVETPEIAETAKLFENVQRKVNIALVNELAMACDALDIDMQQVIKGAATKWNFHEYSPGLVGGHCIPVDPMHYHHQARVAGFTPGLVAEAHQINDQLPAYIAHKLFDGLNECQKPPATSRILVLGLSYKPGVGDVRNSRVKDLVAELQAHDATVHGYDPHADSDTARHVLDIPVAESLRFGNYDALVLATAHEEFREINLEAASTAMASTPVLMDVGGAFNRDQASAAGFVYQTL